MKCDGSCIWREPGTVNCYDGERNCKRCGWNPIVEQARKERIREEMKEPQVETYSIGAGSFDPAIKKLS